MIKILLITIFTILELPFLFKLIKAHQNFEFIRAVAIVIIMIIIALIGFGIFKIL